MTPPRESDAVSAYDFEGNWPDDWPKHRPLNNPDSPPYCEAAHCKNRAVSYILDGVYWAACKTHGGKEATDAR